MSRSIRRVTLCAALLAVAFAGVARAQTRVTSPLEQFGFDIGDDYKLVNYTQVIDYWKKLDAESDRMTVQEMGRTAEGRPQLMAIITSPENQRNIEHYRDIARRLALAEGLTDEQARALAAEGKAVVWIDGGLHADEVLGAQQLLATVYGLVSGNDHETLRILNDVIIVAVWANPDGMELVSNWYMREADSLKRSTRNLPRLYQKYVGHDNNRDFYMSSQPETRNMNRVMYHVWFPQIVYNHHQTGPQGTVMFAPPFRDPFNYNFDPLVVSGIDMVGAAMQTRFLAEDKAGVTVRSGSSYSTWWNGGLRTTAYFHNMIGLLTETIGNPTPMEIPFMVRKQLPSGDLPEPIEPQKWHFKQSIDYSVTANRAVLDYAQRYREQLLFNIYRMGHNSIERGSRDNWTASPKRIDAATVALTVPRAATDTSADNSRRGADDAGPRGTLDKFHEIMRNPMLRDARAYIIPSDQPDFLTATKFINTLIDSNITVMRATKSFQAAGKSYPAGSYVIRTAQPFRPHILDMFEPQDHPNDIPYPGGPPKAPYDNAGYTLAYQMGVRFDRILEPVDGPFQNIGESSTKPPAGRVVAARGRTAGYLLSHDVNDAFLAVNQLLAAKEDVYWLDRDMKLGSKQVPAGTFFVAARPTTLGAVQKIAAETGLVFEATTSKPKGEQLKLRQPRIGLWDRYGGSIPSGWTRYILENFGFPYEVIYASALDAGNLNAKYDALVFVTDAIPERDGIKRRQPDDEAESSPANIPPEYSAMRAEITIAKTLPQLRSFIETGGTLIAEGTSTSIAKNIGLPVQDALTETVDGKERHLPRTKYYVPGSVLEARVDKSDPVATGITDPVNVFYDNSPAFRLATDSTVKRVAWYASATPLKSGWAWGQKYLENATAIADASVGKGRLYLFGPELTFRAQPHGTFKFLFNALYLSTAERTKVK